MALASLVTGVLTSCGGPQSALAPGGRDAERIATLFWWLVAGAAAIWIAVIGIGIYAVVRRDREHDRDRTHRVLIHGGVASSVVILTLLLVHGLRTMPELLDPGDERGPRIRVTGEQWWWRIRYEMPDGTSFELANELRLPRGARVPLWLESPDVIHSLWVPSLAGKVDLIPGRVNRMALEATKPGTYRGACAEFCGSSHANMLLHVVVVEPAEFLAWARAQASPAGRPESEIAARGATLFAAHGCGACHAVRGTDATGVVGPDLTHVGGRVAIGAGIVENDVEGFVNWLAHTKALKPGVHMPSFGMLREPELRALATYLDGLR